MKFLFHARSPLWQMLMCVLFFGGVLVYLLAQSSGDDVPRWLPLTMFVSDFNPFVVLFAMAILTCGHFLVYWISIWPVWREEIAGEE